MVPVWPHGTLLTSASLPDLLAMLSTGQACPTSTRAHARTYHSLSGPLLPRSVHDSSLSTFMCCPKRHFFPAGRRPPSQPQSHAAPPHPRLHCFLSIELRAICLECFIFLFSLLSRAVNEFRGLVLLSRSCAPGARGDSQWAAGVRSVQGVAVWSQLCAACHAVFSS